jgi:hypothetical protein
MSDHVIIGIAAIVGGSTLGLLSAMVSQRMADQVNERLPKDQQFFPLGWYFQKTLRLHREYKRLLPDGNLATKVRTMTALMFACLLIAAWALGFF